MKKIIVATLCLSFFVLCGSARAEKKYQILLRYKDGKISKAVNNCQSEVGRLQPVTRIVNGKARTGALGSDIKKVKLRSISKGVIVDEVEFSFDDMRIVHDNFGDVDINGYAEPMEEMTFFAEIPYREGIVEEIEIVNNEVIEEVMNVEMFVDESDVYRASAGCNLDVVILPERYGEWYGEVYVCTPENLARFREEAANIRDYIENRTPFNEFPDKISWYWPTSVDQMTDQGSRSNPEDPSDVCGGVSLWDAGCTTCHARRIYPDYDELFVLVNEPLYCKGSARKACPFPDGDLSEGKHTFSWGTNCPGRYRSIANHELGHSSFGFDDEYVYYYSDGTPFITRYPPYCSETNCCESCDVVFPNNYGFDQDHDGDGIFNGSDNCPDLPNSTSLGTCVIPYGTNPLVLSYREGNPKEFITCTDNTPCTFFGTYCQMEQGNWNGNGYGDVCECYADVTGFFGVPDGTVNAFDYGVLKQQWGDPCPCQGDFNEDGRVNAFDFGILKLQWGQRQSACHWDLEPGCEGCWQGCTYGNRYRCNNNCTMRATSSEWCARCLTLIRWRLEQCFWF